MSSRVKWDSCSFLQSVQWVSALPLGLATKPNRTPTGILYETVESLYRTRIPTRINYSTRQADDLIILHPLAVDPFLPHFSLSIACAPRTCDAIRTLNKPISLQRTLRVMQSLPSCTPHWINFLRGHSSITNRIDCKLPLTAQSWPLTVHWRHVRARFSLSPLILLCSCWFRSLNQWTRQRHPSMMNRQQSV